MHHDEYLHTSISTFFNKSMDARSLLKHKTQSSIHQKRHVFISFTKSQVSLLLCGLFIIVTNILVAGNTALGDLVP